MSAWLLRVLNITDAVLTLYAVLGGYATELNPLMAMAIAWSPLGFVAIKLAVVELGIWLARRMDAAGSLKWLVWLYAGVVAWNVVGLVLA